MICCGERWDWLGNAFVAPFRVIPIPRTSDMKKGATLVLGIYVHHLYALAKGVRDGCDAVFDMAPVPKQDGYIKVSAELHARIEGVLIDAANLKRLLRPPQARGSKESARRYAFRQQRTTELAVLLAGISIPTIEDAQARNSIEHFDEYLDELGASLESGEPPPKPAAAYNFAFSSWKDVERVIRNEVYPLRVYVADEATYYNFERKISLADLRKEAAAITQRVSESGLRNDMKEPGGVMVMFPPVGTES